MDTYVDVQEGKRVIVCGGRTYGLDMFGGIIGDVQKLVDEILDEYIGSASEGVWPVLVHGGAPGADQLADEWSSGSDVLVEVHKADWDRHGRAAGPIRNQEMADAGADLCIAFPGGKGTADMVKRAKAAGIPVLEVR